MLDTVDLSQKLSKADYDAAMESLEINMGQLQRQAHERGVPITIVFEGWGSSGKGRLVNELLLSLDPRGVKVHSTVAPNQEEFFRPFLWRFWTKIPEKGRIAIYDRSWYSRFIVEKMDPVLDTLPVQKAYAEVNAFERQLIDDGHIIIKFFLHISRQEQKKRFEKLERNRMTAWRVTDYDWKKHKQYETYYETIEEMLSRTNSDHVPWHLVPSHNWRFAAVFETIIDEVARQLKKRDEALSAPAIHLGMVKESKLDKADLSRSLTREQYDRKKKNYQQRLWELEHEIYLRRLSVVIVYEGWDAAGKGGNIKRLVRRMDPRGYEVIPIAAPNDIELAHHYLWRFWTKIPKAGHFAIFDRSWYGRLLVERVEGFARENEWKRAYQEINEMEENLANFGTLIFKFWIHVDQEEQLKRFEEREKTPTKRWKITEEDWRNREKWGVYREAVDEMLVRTDTPHAPWTIVESNNKLYARIKTIETVVKALEKRLITR
ncbi:MAG: phosphate--AMP phosphotransferase [bacterium]|nr:phosphate--AMP phosphotransferase [bacterium]